MTRILHIIDSADPRRGGPIEGALRIGEIWATQGHEQDLLTLDPPGAPYLAEVPARVIAMGRPRTRTPWSRYRYAPGVIRWVKTHAAEYDAVIVAGLWNYSTMAARFGLARGTTPYFVFTHGMLDPWFKRRYPLKNVAKHIFWLFNEGRLLRNARAVLFTTEEERQLARRVFFPYGFNGRVVGYGTADVEDNAPAQIAAFRAVMPAVANRRFLLFLSRIHPKKGCDLLIEAFAELAAAQGDLDLVIAGPDEVGIRAALEAQAARLGIAARVHFPGMLAGDAKWGAFRSCEAFVLTSHQENFGVVVAEAMACGKPVLLSDKVHIWREVVEDGAGLVETDTVEGARALLRRFAALSEDALGKMGRSGRESFLRRFQIGGVARNVLEVMTKPAQAE